MNNGSKSRRLAAVLTANLLWLVIAALIGVGYLINPRFLTPMNISVVLFACTLNGLLALGQSLILIAKEIDLSVGANLVFAPMLAIYVTSYLYDYVTGSPTLVGNTGFMTGGWAVAAAMTLIFSAIIGFINGVIVTKLLVPSFVATIGMAFFLRGMSNVATNGQPIAFRNLEEANFIGNATLGGIVPVSVLIFLFMGLLLMVMARNTKFGMRLYATGGGPAAARLSGISTDKWKIIAFTLCGLLVGIAAIPFMSRTQGLDINQTSPFELNSIAIAIMGGIAISGGKGNFAGPMQATLIVAILLNILNLLGFGAYYQSAITGLIVVFLAVLYKRKDSERLRAQKVVEV